MGIHDLEVNEDNDIQEVDAPKHSKKCGKCKKKGFLKRNLDFCNSCDHEVTTAMTTPSSTTTTEAPSTEASTTAESSTISFARKIDEKGNQKIKERCEKCIKRRFMERNEEFCKTKCVEDEEMEETDETEAEVTTMKTRKNKNKHSIKRNKNRLKNKERRDRNKERKERRNNKGRGNKNKNAEKNIEEEVDEEYEEYVEVKQKPVRMGPLQSFIHYFFRRN